MNAPETAMTTLSISVPEAVKAFVEAQVAAGEYQTVDEYLEKLIREDRERKVEERLAALLTEGLKGPWIEATDEYWERRHAELLTTHQDKTRT